MSAHTLGMSARSFRRALTTVATAAAGVSTMLAVGCGSAQPAVSNPDRAPAVAPAPIDGPLLWRVEGKSGPSYLFGTVHSGVSLDEVGPSVTSALETADTFIAEADLERVDPVELARMATLPPGKTLEEMIGEQSFDELLRLLSPSLTRQQVAKLAPWYAFTSAFQALTAGGPSIDSVLTENAKLGGKRMVFLETWRFQIGLLADQIGAADLKEILDEGSSERETLRAIIGAYKKGDFEQLTALIAGPEAIAKDPDSFQAFFESRNRDWVPKLVPHLREGGAFVAVGAGHFAGDVGLIALLKQAGIEVVRVRR